MVCLVRQQAALRLECIDFCTEHFSVPATLWAAFLDVFGLFCFTGRFKLSPRFAPATFTVDTAYWLKYDINVFPFNLFWNYWKDRKETLNTLCLLVHSSYAHQQISGPLALPALPLHLDLVSPELRVKPPQLGTFVTFLDDSSAIIWIRAVF